MNNKCLSLRKIEKLLVKKFKTKRFYRVAWESRGAIRVEAIEMAEFIKEIMEREIVIKAE